jgi:hypothetical protein
MALPNATIANSVAVAHPSGSAVNLRDFEQHPLLIDAATGRLRVEIGTTQIDAGVQDIEDKLDVLSALMTTISVDLDLVKDDRLSIPGMGIPVFNYAGMTYDGNNNLTAVVYKTGGSGGTTVASLALTYDGNGNLTSILKS